jgi:hypothetical protein
VLQRFCSIAFSELRALALGGTELAKATAGTIRQRLLKIGVLVTVNTHWVYVRLVSAFRGSLVVYGFESVRFRQAI